MNEAIEYAKSINAVFKLTSAFNGTGINEIFEELGRKYIELYNNNVNDIKRNRNNSVFIDKKKHKEESKFEKKKKCKIF